METPDHTEILQAANPAVARRRRDTDGLGQCTVGDPGVRVQPGQQAPIDIIEFGGLNILRFIRPNEGHSRLLFGHNPTLTNFQPTDCCSAENSSHLYPDIRNRGAIVRVGIPTEIKNNEYRVAITPAGVSELVRRGHEVLIQTGAGDGSAISDIDFTAAGAQIVDTADEVWAQANLLLKVKEPIEAEYGQLRKGQVLFTYLHLAASRPCTEALLASGTTSIAYETVQTVGPDGSVALPLLAPMSEVAGRLSAQVGAYHLMRTQGGRGVLMGGVPGVAPAVVVVIGGGMAGDNAAAVAWGMGAHVTVFDLNVNTLRRIDAEYSGAIETRYSAQLELEAAVAQADLVIGAVLVPGAKAPRLVSNALVAQMKPGSVLVDIAIDQGGCFEDSRPTTHDEPTFRVHDSVFYCVANMPGAVPRTSTFALTNATLPYVLKLADKGWRAACQSDSALAKGLSTHEGKLLCEQVGEALNLPSIDPATLLA
jgi:alanine dehydrogenase